MHGGGLGIGLRQSLQHIRYAKPWQQALLTAGLLIGGAVLLASGVLAGLVPALLGALFLRRTVLSIRASRTRSP